MKSERMNRSVREIKGKGGADKRNVRVVRRRGRRESRGSDACEERGSLKRRSLSVSVECELSPEPPLLVEYSNAVTQAAETALEHFRLRRGEVSVVFVDDCRIRELNREHRNTDRSTDVLSFPQYGGIREAKEADYPYFGDIVISLETAEAQAKEFGHSVRREISYLTVHSVLHLLGYDHIEEEEKKRMRYAEKEIMHRMGVYRGELV